jgi:hypothetical protein
LLSLLLLSFATSHSSFSISSSYYLSFFFCNLLRIFAVPFPEFSLAYNISPFYSFSRIHPPIFSTCSRLSLLADYWKFTHSPLIIVRSLLTLK